MLVTKNTGSSGNLPASKSWLCYIEAVSLGQLLNLSGLSFLTFEIEIIIVLVMLTSFNS